MIFLPPYPYFPLLSEVTEISESVFTTLLLSAIVTTLIAPLLLPWTLAKEIASQEA